MAQSSTMEHQIERAGEIKRRKERNAVIEECVAACGHMRTDSRASYGQAVSDVIARLRHLKVAT